MPPGKPPTMHDVAALAGVSQRTVSNVVRGVNYVADATRARVEAAIQELGYQPNLAAQRLRTGRTGMIALAAPDLTWPYFAHISQLLYKEARAVGFTLLAAETGGSAASEREVLLGLKGSFVDGVVLSPIELSAGNLKSLDLGMPMVLIGEQISGVGIPHFSIDNQQAARDMAQHLVERDVRDVWILGSTHSSATSSAGPMRYDGFTEVFGSAGVTWQHVSASPWTMQEGRRAVELMLAEKPLPDAVVCFNDLLALGAQRALWAAGHSVPIDVLVTGWDDISMTDYATPSITTIAADTSAIARHAVASLVAQIKGKPLDAADVTIGHRVVAKESSDRSV